MNANAAIKSRHARKQRRNAPGITISRQTEASRITIYSVAGPEKSREEWKNEMTSKSGCNNRGLVQNLNQGPLTVHLLKDCPSFYVRQSLVFQGTSLAVQGKKKCTELM
ncbi:hypothetical protein NQZ68_007517 [Dissostichus eleginoides]|nr:hypothetical protein NQZ68_007517 [Dissostichus eleginoides]